MPKPIKEQITLRRRQLERSKFDREKKSGPINNITWLSRVEEAYKARQKFTDLITRAPIAKYSLLKNFDLTTDQIKTARIEYSKDTPAINIFVNSLGNKIRGQSTELNLKGIGRLYVNVVDELDILETTLQHEEEHTRLFLNRFSKRITDFDDVTELVFQETISEISGHFGKGSIGPMTGFFFSRWLPQYIKTMIDSATQELITNTNESQFKPKPEIIEHNKRFLEFEMKKIIGQIIKLLDFNQLTPQEIISVMRTSEFRDVEKNLKEYASTKYKYSRKQRNKTK